MRRTTKTARRDAALTDTGRQAIIAAVLTAAILVLTQFLLPEGTPVAVLFQGLVFGLLNALIAVGLVLIYRSHRFINFAQPALGVVGGVFTANLIQLSEWPFALALVAGVIVAAGVGLIFQLAFVLRFFHAPRLVLTVFSIAVIPAFQALAGLVNLLPLFPPVEDRPVFGGAADLPLPFEGFGFEIGAFRLQFGFAHILAIGLSVIALLALAGFFRYTRVGTAVRAAAENVDRARMLGISTAKLSMLVWIIAGGLSGLGVILAGSVQRQFSPGVVPPELIVIPLAGAVLARFESFPMAALGAVVLTMARAAVTLAYPEQAGLADLGLFVAIVVLLLIHQRRRSTRSEETEATSFETVQEHRPIPREMMALASVANARRVLIGLGIIALIVFPLAATPAQVNNAGYFILVGISILSLVVLTGWTGQASLGQFAFVAVGAVVGGALTARLGLSFWIAVLIVPFFVAGFATLMGLPALRIRGLFLAVVTFAFAIATQAILFEERFFGWLLPGAVDRPSLFLLDFEDNRSMYYLNLVAFVLAVLLITVLRRTRTGRLLIAMRENENNLRAFGVNPVRMRLAGFAISGFLCGFAGVILAHHQRAVTQADFPAELSVFVFLDAVVGGVGSIAGAMLGTLYFALFQSVSSPLWGQILPVLTLAILYISPAGLAAILTSLRDGVLKIVAQRRQMVVPALYADMDPEALERRLIPLAEPIPNAGLDALPFERRYAAASGIYATRGRTLGDGEARREDALALGAAARAFGEEEETPGGSET